MGCLHDPANVQQTSSKCIQNTRANAGRLLDRINTLLGVSVLSRFVALPVTLCLQKELCVRVWLHFQF